MGTPRRFPLDTPKHTLSKKRIMPPSSMGGEKTSMETGPMGRCAVPFVEPV